MRQLSIALFIVFLSACASESCRKYNKRMGEEEAKVLLTEKSSLTGEWVYKYDGSVQCDLKKAQSVEAMRNRDLAGIQVLASLKLNDGLLRTQVCGSGTGEANVYLVSKADLQTVLKRGFEKWTFTKPEPPELKDGTPGE